MHVDVDVDVDVHVDVGVVATDAGSIVALSFIALSIKNVLSLHVVCALI